MKLNSLHPGEQSKTAIREAVPFLGLIVISLFFQVITGGKLISHGNLKAFSNIAFQMIIPACGAVYLLAQGNLDYSMAGNICICAYFAAKASHINPWLVIPVAIVIGMIIGSINGFVTVFFRVPSFIATLAASFIYGGIASVLLGGGAITANFDLKLADTLAIKYGVIAFALIITWLILSYTPFGKQCKAIGAKEEAARQSGINVNFKKMIAFIICGLSCGIMACFTLIRSCTAATNSGGMTQLNTMLALLLGGVPFSGGWASKFRCVLVGGLLMSVVTSGLTLTNISSEMQQIIKGLMFVVAVAISFDRKNTAVIK